MPCECNSGEEPDVSEVILKRNRRRGADDLRKPMNGRHLRRPF
jgi:hypothetical protein